MDASLVFDGTKVVIPESMGTPLPDQCQGTSLEILGEISSRICYDSLGLDENGKRRGRASSALHEHILQVRNHSVYEHCNFTVRIAHKSILGSIHGLWASCMNRKGIWLKSGDECTEITVNFRTVLEWERHSRGFNATWTIAKPLGECLWHYARALAPAIFSPPSFLSGTASGLINGSELVTELDGDQAHVTLWLYGSRGFTHEQVRHRFAISQRSTRYVDEDGSPYITHPLVTKFLTDPSVATSLRETVMFQIRSSVEADRQTYRRLVSALQEYCMGTMGLDKTQGRKQARGAARGYLGNALASEMLFTASVNNWKWILSQRKNALADAEIRQVYTPGLAALQSSQYESYFLEFKTGPSPDGIGTVLI